MIETLKEEMRQSLKEMQEKKTKKMGSGEKHKPKNSRNKQIC